MMETEPRIPLREAKEQVALVCRDWIVAHGLRPRSWCASWAKARERDSWPKPVKEYSRRIGQAKKERALQEGLDLGPESFHQMSDLPRFGMHERVEEVEVDGEKRIRAHGCVMGNVWREHGKDALGRYYCYVDPASSMAFDPGLKLVHTRALPTATVL